MASRFTSLLAYSATVWGVVRAVSDVSDFDWSTVEPSRSLNFTDCYDGHKCARLIVPMDWLNPEDDSDPVIIAIGVRPAVVDASDPSFGGTIITNPGGPGGNGLRLLLGSGETLQKIADGKKKYEIMSFDPRGVGETLPRSDCWRDEFGRQSFANEELAIGSPASGEYVLKRMIARAKGFGMLCERGAKKGEKDIRNFISTSSVARDMVEIVDKLAELRSSKPGKGSGDAGEEDENRLELRDEKEVARIQYWGFSYGTVLGNYFASMFPGRVGRVVLEGVVDIDDYYNGTWAHNLNDVTHTYEHLWETCFAGGDRCALFKSGDKGAEDIRKRFEKWLSDLDDAPGAYVSDTTVHSVTPYDVTLAMFRPLYAPMQMFENIAKSIAEAMNGNYTGIFNAIPRPGFNDSCPLKVPTSYTWTTDAQRAIACGDSLSQIGMTVEDLKGYLGHLLEQSPRFGPYWTHIRTACIGWNYRPEYAFSGPWITPESDPSLVQGKPAAPLLFVSSKYDPVTPLENAYLMSKRHPGSGVLVQDSVGHATIGTPGKCRDEWVKKYFETGEVPPVGTNCHADCVPFKDCAQANSLDDAQAVAELYRRPLLEVL